MAFGLPPTSFPFSYQILKLLLFPFLPLPSKPLDYLPFLASLRAQAIFPQRRSLLVRLTSCPGFSPHRTPQRKPIDLFFCHTWAFYPRLPPSGLVVYFFFNQSTRKALNLSFTCLAIVSFLSPFPRIFCVTRLFPQFSWSFSFLLYALIGCQTDVWVFGEDFFRAPTVSASYSGFSRFPPPFCVVGSFGLFIFYASLSASFDKTYCPFCNFFERTFLCFLSLPPCFQSS